MLTRREEEASAILAEGCGRAELAERLGVSVSAADKLVHALKAKLGAANRSELALRCRERREAGPAKVTTNAGLRVARPGAPGGTGFADADTIDELFARLVATLEPLGVTHVAYSHIRQSGAGPIEHLASRWTFPPEVTFDMSIPPDENLAFKHAVTSWEPVPLDLEAMMASDIYSYVPEPIRRQNDVFVAAGLVRGITFALPGLGLDDRLVLSMLLRDAGAARFAAFLRDDAERAHLIALTFRHAHVALARPHLALNEREHAVLGHLADGMSIDEAAEALGISRRAADRVLEGARAATGRSHNTGAVGAWLRDRAEPHLPF